MANDRLIHCRWRHAQPIEIFDEDDLDDAIAKFEQLSQPPRRLENAATRAYEHFRVRFEARDWDAIAEMIADDHYTDDRRHMVGTGVGHGRDAEIAGIRATASLGVTSLTLVPIATRGDRLALCRVRGATGSEADAFADEVLRIVEIDADERIATRIAFDPDDTAVAFAELDARHVAGEAAAHAHTWSVVAGAYAAFNRHELFATTPDWSNIDHRRGIGFAPGEMTPYLRASWDVTPDIIINIEAVHRLSDVGAVVTHATQGRSQEGFDAEWRVITLLTVKGDLIDRCERFDETDMDAALARFDELSRPTRRLENAATQVGERFRSQFAAHDWEAVAGMFAADFCMDDRRRVVNGGVRNGRDAEVEDLQAFADIGINYLTFEVIATRGERLMLGRGDGGNGEQAGAVEFDVLQVVEIDADESMTRVVMFDPDDIDAAIAELDARYVAGEAAAHGHTWSLITQAFAGFNRGELPASTQDSVTVDHRRVAAMAPGEGNAYFRASWELAAELCVHIESVHLLNDLGAVFTHVGRGTSRDGFEAEWRTVDIMTVDGELISRGELFDEADLDAALARFDELCRPVRHLENAATQVDERYRECYTARDWDALTQIFAPDILIDDRRRPVNAGVVKGRDAIVESIKATADLGNTNVTSTVLATRGERLILTSGGYSGKDQGPEAFRTELLTVIEINDDNRTCGAVVFDRGDTAAAFAELDARYLAGEAAAHAQTWSVLMQAYAALNRHEVPPTAPVVVDIDHRPLASIGSGDLIAYIRTGMRTSRASASTRNPYID